MNKKGFLFVVGLLFVLTIVFYFSDLDLAISSLFFDGKWFLAERQPWLFLYDYGNIPSISMGVASLIYLIISIFKNNIREFRRAAIFILLTLILGPGLMVNSVFKKHWGRQRPRQVEQFQADGTFTKVWVKTSSGGSSFPSGHAAIGFFVLTPFFVFVKRYKKLAYTLFWLGFAYGLFMGVGRVVQGAHFTSDVLWSFGMVFLCNQLLYLWIKPDI